MFTGIITGIGHIVAAAPKGKDAADGLQLIVQCPSGFLNDVALGDSIALNGACMTATRVDAAADLFSLDISSESLEKTAGLGTLGALNLEKALRATDRLGGHIVSGHVDGIGHVRSLQAVGGDWFDLTIAATRALAPYLAYKGSIAINGVSLTVNSVQDEPDACVFSMRLIPQTLSHTTLGQLKPKDAVNLEIDTVARYVKRMLSLTA